MKPIILIHRAKIHQFVLTEGLQQKHITKGFLANGDFHLISFKSYKAHVTLRSVQITLYKVSDHNPDHTPTLTIIFSLFFLCYIALRSF